jgi:hypothetical protein
MAYGNNGAFRLRRDGVELTVIASDGADWDPVWGFPKWEHVSVSTPRRCPTWDEMQFIKQAFWDDEDCVVQFHPPKSQYVNRHPFCLHLWRPVGVEIPMPPMICVG